MVIFYIEFVYDLLTTDFISRIQRGDLKVRMTIHSFRAVGFR